MWRRQCGGARGQSVCQLVDGYQILAPLVAWGRTNGHVSHEQHAATILDSSGLLLERGGGRYQYEWPKMVTLQVDTYNELVWCKQVVLVHGDRSLRAVEGGLAFDLQGQVGAVAEPVNHSVDSTIEHGQENMETAA